MPDSEITSVLVQIRDGIIAMHVDLSDKIGNTNARLDQTNARLDQTNARLDQTNSRLDSVEGKLDAIGRFVKSITRRHDKAIDELRERVAKLEARRKN